jgi:UDP-N-acetylmuramoyl-tripeptide--D-alanyl-D-alanine ligase
MMSLDRLSEYLGVPGETGYLFDRAVIDSRKARPGSLFFALPGTRTDGHSFVEEALALGAAAVVSRDGFSGPVLRVSDTGEALLKAGRWARDRFECPVAAVTGSSGKTTTREMLMAALSGSLRVDGTRENLNNRLGLPLTLLNSRPDAQALVVELGMNHFGELRELGAVARPGLTVVTNIGTAHIEFLGSREGIARAKAELLSETVRGGAAVIPFGEPALMEAARERDLRIFTTGPGGDAWVEDGELMPWRIRPELAVPGPHNLSNALSAAVAADLLGVEPVAAVKAMEGYSGMAGRGRIWRGRGVVLYDESYNSNPDSAAACLELLRGAGDRGVAVLGDMLELGPHGRQAHLDLIRNASAMGLRLVILVGEELGGVFREEPGMEWVPDAGAALKALRKAIRPGDRVLVKGSHSLGLDLVVRGIREEGD